MGNLPALRASDATWALPRIAAPTLIMARPELAQYPMAVARTLVDRIPRAQLQLFAGASFMPSIGDSAAVLTALQTFLSELTPQRPLQAPAHGQEASLTAREVEVLTLLARGRTGREIAADLTISLSTVQRHIAHIYGKVGARGRVEAATYAYANGLVMPADA